jgi:hypothetical protein
MYTPSQKAEAAEYAAAHGVGAASKAGDQPLLDLPVTAPGGEDGGRPG